MKTRGLTTLAAIFILTAGAACAAPADSLAFIVAIEGNGTVQRGQGPELLSVGSTLAFGDTLVIGPASTCRIQFLDGRTLDLTGHAQLVLAKSPQRSPASLFGDWIRHELADWLGEDSVKPLRTRSLIEWNLEEDAPAPIFPAHEGSLRADRAVVTWIALSGVDRYVLTLSRQNGSDEIHNVRGNTFRISDPVRGADYLWKVAPDIKEWPGHSSWREFRVLTKEEELEVDQAIEKCPDLDAAAILLGVGLHEEAIARLDTEIEKESNPTSARLWRAKALESLGLYEQACEELRKAGCFR
jgi:hypothetical protein